MSDTYLIDCKMFTAASGNDVLYVENRMRIIRHLFYRTKLVSVTQFSTRLMDFCSSPWSIANLRRGNEGDRGRAHREMNRKELWRANKVRLREKERQNRRERQSASVTRAKERRRDKERGSGARVSRSGKFISTITGARRYMRFGNEGLALVRNSRVARARVFRKKP